MSVSLCSQPSAGSQNVLHDAFLAAMPRIELHGRVFFRGIQCPHRKEEAITEMIALCWSWFARLAQRGKDPTTFISALASYAARQVQSGRRLCGQERAKDVMSPLAQQRHGFAVRSLSGDNNWHSPLFEDALRDNTQTAPLDAAAFRIDFPRWHGDRSERDQRIVDELMVGERTGDMARRHGLSPGRISQLRRELHQDWQQFHGEPMTTVA